MADHRTFGPHDLYLAARRKETDWHFDAASVTIITAPGEARVQILLEGGLMPTLPDNSRDMAFVERGARTP